MYLTDPVFIGTMYGQESVNIPGSTAIGSSLEDKRTSSVGAAAEFAKANNLLGLFVEADLLVSVRHFFPQNVLTVPAEASPIFD